MRKIATLFIFIGIAFMLVSCNAARGGNQGLDNGTHNGGDNNNPVPLAFTRGAWVATVYGIDFPQTPTTNSNLLKQQIDGIVQNAAEKGIDALFFQARPCADAFYKSAHFPWSKYLTGTQGVAPSNNFDPLSYIIEECHANGIQLHAWINPYRITALATDTLVSNHVANIVPWITMRVGGKLYFNPGEPVARGLIVEGVREIIQNYDVDGIHFDDYFYPEGITDEDAFTFAGRWSGPDNLADWRRWNVNQLIRQTRQVIRETASHVAFGISPAGIWANKTSNPLGSDTKGYESYYAIYADSRGWVKNAWIDYIVPQIYWYVGQQGSDFTTVLNWWCEVCKGTDVALYVGLAAYRVNDGTFARGGDEITAQLALADELADGVVAFSLKDL